MHPPETPLSLEDAKSLIQPYVDRYNYVRLHSAIGYVTPNDMLAGRQAQIHAERDRKLEEARTTPTSDLGGCRAPIAELLVNLHGQCRILQLDFWWAAPRALEEVHDLVTGTL